MKGFYNKWWQAPQTLFFHKTKILIRIEDIAQVWNQGGFGKTTNKEKLLGKSLVDDRNDKLKQYPKNLVFFDFPRPLKNNKDKNFEALKHFEN